MTTPKYRDSTLAVQDRVADLVDHMDIDEKRPRFLSSKTSTRWWRVTPTPLAPDVTASGNRSEPGGPF
jgi:hypothetical protein